MNEINITPERFAMIRGVLDLAARGCEIEIGISGDAWQPADAATVLQHAADTAYSFRAAPRPEPKIPDAPIFWVRLAGSSDVSRLVVCIDEERHTVEVGTLRNAYEGQNVAFKSLFKGWHWSPDRKRWYDFTGKEIR